MLDRRGFLRYTVQAPASAFFVPFFLRRQKLDNTNNTHHQESGTSEQSPLTEEIQSDDESAVKVSSLQKILARSRILPGGIIDDR